MGLCIICRERKAAVPDRDSGSKKLKVCSMCHRERLKNDLRHILAVERKRWEKRKVKG